MYVSHCYNITDWYFFSYYSMRWKTLLRMCNNIKKYVSYDSLCVPVQFLMRSNCFTGMYNMCITISLRAHIVKILIGKLSHSGQ